jgi:hypothetical protein
MASNYWQEFEFVGHHVDDTVDPFKTTAHQQRRRTTSDTPIALPQAGRTHHVDKTGFVFKIYEGDAVCS